MCVCLMPVQASVVVLRHLCNLCYCRNGCRCCGGCSAGASRWLCRLPIAFVVVLVVVVLVVDCCVVGPTGLLVATIGHAVAVKFVLPIATFFASSASSSLECLALLSVLRQLVLLA